MSNNRDVSFDIMKAFAIFLVVLGHCMQSLYPEKGEFVGKPLFLYVYSFHMALFMMISGYFSTRALSGSFKQLIESKTRQLLQPAIVAGGGYHYCRGDNKTYIFTRHNYRRRDINISYGFVVLKIAFHSFHSLLGDCSII